VRSTKKVRFRTLFTATQIGFLANFILPLRAGEIIRAFILGQRAGIAFSRGVALVAMDRVADLFGLGACVLLSIGAINMAEAVVLPPDTFGNASPLHFAPSFVRTGAMSAFLGLIVVVTTVILLYANRAFVYRMNDRVLGLISKKFAARVRVHLEQFAQGLSVLGSPADMVNAIFWSLMVWGCFVLSAMCFFKAFGLECPWYTPFLVQVLVAIAVSVPGAPGFVGQYHLAFVVAVLMAVPSASPAEAKAIAITAHLLNFIPTVLVGIVCLVMEQSGLLELTRQSARAEQETATE
jgi:uncharacterized protein (TIRG00374 family)